MKKTLLWLVAGALLVFVAVKAMPQKEAEQNDEETKTEQAEVEMKEGAVALPDEAEYTLDLEKSSMGWESSKKVGGEHAGKVLLKEGSLIVEGGELASGSFTIDMDSISDNDGSAGLVKHLKNADFFDVAKYKTSQFEVSTAERNEDGTYKVTGELTILDQTNEITFDLLFVEAAEGLHATAAFSIDRTKWGIDYSSGSVFEQLGDKAIRDDIGFTLDLFLK